MREECKFFESRTYPNGDAVRKCDLDLAPEAASIGEDPSIAALLDEAEDIINAVVDTTRAEVDGEGWKDGQLPSSGPLDSVKRFFRRRKS